LDTLTYDIETVPQQQPLTDIQQEELDRQLEKIYARSPEMTDEDKLKLRRQMMATNPYFGEIICIGLHKTVGDLFDSTSLTGDEYSILERFWKIIGQFKGIFISFNGLNFDIPFILKRSMKHGILPTNNDFLDMKRYSRKPHFDVKLIIGDWDKYASGTLRLVCEHLNIKSPKEGGVKAENVEDEFKKGNINAIAEYCLKDVLATYEAYLKINKYLYQPNKY
jgi:predicted PolB exonuclease-like 3'-5' exonuclease